MASVEKYVQRNVKFELRHNSREHARPPANQEILPALTYLNYALHPPSRGQTTAQNMAYFKKRIEDVYVYGRSDVKVAAQWIVTAPSDVAPDQERSFFEASYRFICQQYGEENIVQAWVHYDEGIRDKTGNLIVGRPHLHVIFIPVVQNMDYGKRNKSGNISKKNTFREKVCADELITKRHLQNFHPAFQKFLDSHGIKASVHTGVTGGQNRSVAELKAETKELLEEREKVKALKMENALLQEKVESLQQETSRMKHRSWGSVDGWGTECAWGGGRPIDI